MKLVCLVGALVAFAQTAHAASALVYVKDENDRRVIQLAHEDGTAVRALPTAGAVQLYPRLSSDGRFVAFAEGEGEANLRIVTRELATDELIEWTDTRGWHLQPRFSGDGKLLAFASPSDGGGSVIEIIDFAAAIAAGTFEVMADRGDGLRRLKYAGPSRKIEEAGAKLYFPNLSADGHFIVYHRTKDAQRKELVRLDLETNERTTLTEVDGYAVAPSLSFDDRQVAYGTRYNGQSEIALLDLATGATKRLTNDTNIDADPSMHPGGSVSYSTLPEGSEAFALYVAKPSLTNGPTEIKPLVVVAASVFTSAYSGDLSLERSLLPEMTNPARSSFGSVRIGTKVFIAGGHQGHEHTYPPESFMDRVEYYDLASKTWHKTAPRSVACHGFALAAHGKYVYAFGGFTYSADHLPKWKSLDLIERYDTEQDRWETVGHLAMPRSSYVLGKVGGKVYLLGGWDSTPQRPNDAEGRFHRTVEVFDLATEEVSVLDVSLPDPLRRALSGVTVGDEIWLIGGLGVGASHFELLDKVTAFNPKTRTFRELPALPFATFAPAAGVAGGSLYLFGGMFKTGEMDYRYVNHVFEFPVDGGAPWRHAGRYLAGNKGFSQVVPLEDEGLLVLGGHSYDGETDAPVRTVELWQAVAR